MITESYNQRSEFLSEKQKDTDDYLISSIDSIIAELVYEKDDLKKAYNYYNGELDKDQYKHLEDNYGIGNPTSLEYIPLIRRHVDVLIGQQLQNKIKPKITCKDKKTLTDINKLREEEVKSKELDTIKSQFFTNLNHVLSGNAFDPTKLPPVDFTTEQEIEKLRLQISKEFISEYEKAAQNIITHLIQSKTVDLYHKLKMMFLDLLVVGQCYYKVSFEHEGESPDVEVLNPLDVFYDYNPNSPYIKDSARAVVRKFMSKQHIINKYGHLFETQEDLDALDNELHTSINESNIFYVRTTGGGLVANTGVAVSRPYSSDSNVYNSGSLITVYEVEWISNNKITLSNGKTSYRMDRYEGVRIGECIYVKMGKSEHIMRSVEHPNRCSLTINGISYTSRNGKPYSLVIACAPLQDKYSVLHFHRDVLIGSAGTKGDWIQMKNIPSFLGQNPTEKLLKWVAYKKAGLALIEMDPEDPSANINTTFGGFDDTVSPQAIQAIELAITSTENTCSAITGVFRELLGGIEQRDAVANVAVGVTQSAVITKPYFQLMDNATAELLTDALNMCKLSYKKGIVGVIILGEAGQKIFTADPKYYVASDHDVHIGDSGDIVKQMQKIEAVTMEMLKAGMVDVDIIIDAMTTESLTDMREVVLNSVEKKKKENNQLQQVMQQLEQAQQQAQQMQSELQKMSGQVDQYKQSELQLKEREIENDFKLRSDANKNTSEFNAEKLRVQQKQLELEQLQLLDADQSNNEVKNI